MAILQVLGSDKALRLNNFNTLGLVQSFNWAPNFNAQDVFELGRTTRLDSMMELETSGSIELMGAGNLAGMLARMQVQMSAGEFNGFKYNPVASGSALGTNGYSFTQDDLTNLKFDLVLHEKTDQTNFNRSTYLACCYPTTISGRVDANGTARDTINWAGQYVIGFPKPYHDVRSVPAKRASASTLTLLDAAYTATDWEIAYITIDGISFSTTSVTSFTGSTITLTGVTVPASAVVMVALYKKTPTAAWSSVHAPDTVGSGASAVYGVRGYQANVYIAPVVAGSPTSAEQWLRVQSLDYNIDFRVEALRQVAKNLQGTSIYMRVPTLPFTMSLNATVLETDWADWKQILDSTLKPFDREGQNSPVAADVYKNTYDFAPKNMDLSFAVVIDYFTKDGTKVQNLQFTDLRIDGMGNRTNVGGRGEITWSFRGSAMNVTGTNI